MHETVQNLANSVAYNTETGILSFTIPKEIPQGYSLFIHVSARLKMDDGGMSFHAFEKESKSGNWELGKTYTVKINKDALLQALVVVALKEKYNSELLFEKRITVDEKGTVLISQ